MSKNKVPNTKLRKSKNYVVPPSRSKIGDFKRSTCVIKIGQNTGKKCLISKSDLSNGTYPWDDLTFRKVLFFPRK